MERCYLLLRIESNSASPKKLSEDLNLLMQKSDDIAASSADDALHAEDFFKFFTDKISQIQKETDGAPDTEYASNPGASFSMFQPTTAKQLEDLIAAAPNKHCLLDPAPTSLIKKLHIVAVAVSVGTV